VHAAFAASDPPACFKGATRRSKRRAKEKKWTVSYDNGGEGSSTSAEFIYSGGHVEKEIKRGIIHQPAGYLI